MKIIVGAFMGLMMVLVPLALFKYLFPSDYSLFLYKARHWYAASPHELWIYVSVGSLLFGFLHAMFRRRY